MLIFQFILFVIACAALAVSGGWLIKLLIKLAATLRLSDFVVAFIIMAFATSIPELAVGISAALKGTPELSLGNVLGSNIIDVTLILGLAILLARGIRIKNPHIHSDSLTMVLIVLVPLVLMLLGSTLSRLDGLILVLVFIFYILHLAKGRRTTTDGGSLKGKQLWLLLAQFSLALLVLFVSAHFVVRFATDIAAGLHLPLVLIGLFLVAIGTSLPELVFEIRSALAGKPDLAVGDAMGSVVCNSTLILGLTALIHPVKIDLYSYLTSALVMLFALILFTIFVRHRRQLSVWEAIILILVYVVYIVIEFYLRPNAFSV